MISRHLLIILGLLLLSPLINAQSYQKVFGGDSIDDCRYMNVTEKGNFILTGTTRSFGAGKSDISLVKISKQGDTLWTKAYGGSNNESGWFVEQTNDKGFIVAGITKSFGAGQEDAYLLKADSNGNKQWFKTYGGISNDRGYAVRQTNDDGYILTGRTESYGAGSADLYLVKTDSLGDTIWTKTYGGADFEGSSRVLQTNDSGFITLGTTNSYGAGNNDIYLIKTDNNGDSLWTKTYGGTSNENGRDIIQTKDGGFALTGFTRSFTPNWYEVYLIKINSQGDTLWSKNYGGVNDDRGYSLQQTNDTGFIITGRTNSFGGGDYDIYLIRTNSTGDTLWTKSYGDSLKEQALSILSLNGDFIVGGSTNSFGKNIYIVKTDSFGNGGGCNQYNTNTLVSNPNTQAGSGGIIGTGGITNSPSVTEFNTITNESLLCYCQKITPQFSYTKNNLTVSFIDSSIGATTWHWDYGDGDFSNQQNPDHTFDTAGTYNVCLTVSNSCDSDTLCDSITIQTTGINYDSKQTKVEVYPNPFTKRTAIYLKNKPGGKVKLEIYNTRGQKIKTRIKQNPKKIEINRKELKKGLFIFKLTGEGGNIKTGKMMIR